MKRVQSDSSLVVLPQTNYRDLPNEVWVKILTFLTLPHGNQLNCTCWYFKVIFENGLKNIFESHFPTAEMLPNESPQEAYQREYKFLLCPPRTKCEQVGNDIPFLGNVCLAVHDNWLYVAKERQLEIFDLVTQNWVRPPNANFWNGEVSLLRIVPYKLAELIHILALPCDSSSLYQMDLIGSFEHQLPIKNQEEKMIALGVMDRKITVLSQLGFLYVGEARADGASRWPSRIKLPLEQENPALESPDCHFFQDRLIILEPGKGLSIFHATLGELKFKVQIPIPEVFCYEVMIDGDKLVMMERLDGSDDVQFSYVDLKTKKMHTRPREEAKGADSMSNGVIHYLNGQARLVMSVVGNELSPEGRLPYFLRILTFKPE